MASDNNENKKQLNIGLVIFGIIFMYLIATVFRYFTDNHITVYEVREGSILKDTAYTGLALRKEVVIQSAADGYINYYVPNCSKVKVGSDIYTLSDEKLDFSEDVEENFQITSTKEQTFMLAIQQFNYDYHPSDFSEVYRLKTELRDSLISIGNNDKLAQLSTLLQEEPQGISLHATADDGLVVYTVDGMEHLTIDNATISDLNKSKYKSKQFSDNVKVQTGESIYKLVLDDAWTIMIELDKETAESLMEKKYVKVNIEKDNQTLWADLSIIETEGHYIAYLSFESGMIRYVSERFIDIKLILEDETGLKIPKSARTEKDFFVVPSEYITRGGENNARGVLLQVKSENGKIASQFMDVTVYYETDGFSYLDPNDFEAGTTLIKPESNSVYNLSEKRMLEGVFSINKGYAIFKQIHILCESDSYYIIEDGTRYGLSNYDHIALDSSNIKENDVVF